MRGGLLAVVVYVLSVLASVDEPPSDSTHDFPRNYFLHSFVSKNRATRAKAIVRAEREFADDPRMARTLAGLLRRIHTNDGQVPTAVSLIGLLHQHRATETEQILAELLAAEDPRITIAALDVLIARPNSALLPTIADLAKRLEFREIFGFRFTVLTAVTKIPGRESAAFFIEHLPQLTGRSEKLVLRHLARASGQDFGRDYAAWSQWLQEGASSPHATVASAELDENEGSSSQPSFFGIPVHAKRLAFVVDKSGSMSDRLNLMTDPRDRLPVRGVNETRIARAQRELTNAVTRLPGDAHFNIVVFDHRVAAWQPSLVPASAANKSKALRFISSIPVGGHTAWYDALSEALALDGNLEAVYFLTDGEPSFGRIVSQPEIVRIISRENRFRRVAIHTVGMGVSTTAEGFLKALADANGGTFRSVGQGQANLVKQLRPKVNVRKFEPRRVFRRPMPPVSDVRASSAQEVGQRVKGDELVLGVSIDEQARAYPINMLTGPNREIINDQLGGRAIAATWCHLCHSGIVYSRDVRERTLTFAVSGLLWNSNLVMIDTKTKSLWSQLYGKAMRGSMRGAELERLPATLTDWNTWRELHPETTVVTLSRSTREYDRDFYRELDRFVVGVARDDAARAWPLSVLSDGPVVNDEFAGQPLLVTFDPLSKTVFVFDRRVEEQTLWFVEQDGVLVDDKTQSRWDANAGQAVSGPLRGQQLRPVPSTTSYRAVWEIFYPRSTFCRIAW